MKTWIYHYDPDTEAETETQVEIEVTSFYAGSPGTYFDPPDYPEIDFVARDMAGNIVELTDEQAEKIERELWAWRESHVIRQRAYR